MIRWILYILECSDRSLYTGITTDLEKRVAHHNKGDAARYTRSRRPVKLVYERLFEDESAARKEEARIKTLPRSEKLKIIQ